MKVKMKDREFTSARGYFKACYNIWKKAKENDENAKIDLGDEYHVERDPKYTDAFLASFKESRRIGIARKVPKEAWPQEPVSDHES